MANSSAPFTLLTNWPVQPLGDVCKRGGGNIQTGPFGSQLHQSDYVEHGIPSIMPVNIGDNRIFETGIARITLEDATRLIKYRVQKGDIVYSRRGDVERRSLVREHEDGWLCGTGCLRVRFGEGIVDHIYASYYLAHPDVKAWVVRHAVGATMPNLNTGILSDLPFVTPPLKTQQAIAHILGTLDDKIDLNRRMNETLEAMARALFKSWFVDFDPVKAKMEGRQPAGMDAETAALFPDRLVESELGMIPEGWRGGVLKQFCDLQNGYAFKSKDWKSTGIPVVKIGSVKPGEVDLTQVSYISSDLATEKIGFQLNIGDMLVGLTGYVGETGRIPPTQALPMLNQRVGRFIPRSNFHAYTFACVRRSEFKEYAQSKAHGSAQPNVSTKDLLDFPCTIPSEQSLALFERKVGGIYQKHLTNMGQTAVLTQLRDTLLSKLISGEISVAEAEERMGDA